MIRVRRKRPPMRVATTAPAETPPARDLYATQVITRQHVARLYRLLVWLALAWSFALSILGNVRMFGGDVTQLVARGVLNSRYALSGSFLGALAGAAAYQLVIQVFQFRYATERRFWRQYLALIGLSTIPSLWTFAPLLQWLADGYKLGLVPVFGGALLVLALNDVMQERMLQE